MHCREHVVQLHHRVEDFRAAGAGLIVIGNGSPSFIAGFRDETGWRGPLYVDPSLALYAAAGMKRGVMSTFNLRSAARSVGTLRRGFRQGKMQGDPWQQGGVLVVARDGRVIWSHASGGPGDNAQADAILAALR